MIKRNRLSIVVVLAICLILILPAIIYQYPYPNHSDDTPRHLAVIERIVNGQGYSDLWQVRDAYAGPAFTGLIIKALHTNPYWTFYVFHYLALIGMVLSIWFFSYKVFNKTAANLAAPFVVLCTPPFIQYFYNGVIFNMINLFIFGLMAVLALVYWLRTRRLYFAAISIMLFGIMLLYHSASGLYFTVGVGFYLGCVMLINVKKQAWGELRRLGLYTAVFIGLCGTLALTLAPQIPHLLRAANSGITGTATAAAGSALSAPDFLLLYTNSIIVIILIIALAYILRHKISLSSGMGVILSIAFCLAIAVFVLKSLEPTRVAHDLAMLISLAGAGAAGVALQKINLSQSFRNQRYLTIAVSVLVIAMALPMSRFWLTYQSAVRPADQQAIAALGELQGENYSCSTQIQPSIYSIFLQGKTCTPAGGDYILYRSDPMTGETDPADVWSCVKGNISTEADYAGLPVVGEYYDGNVRVVIYKNGG